MWMMRILRMRRCCDWAGGGDHEWCWMMTCGQGGGWGGEAQGVNLRELQDVVMSTTSYQGLQNRN